MGRWYGWARMGAMAAVAVVMVNASAQTTYRCASGSSTILSDRPCTAGAGSKFGAIGPQTQAYATPGSPYLPSIGKAPDHIAYLSPLCASLNDAIRTGPARGLKSNTLADLNSEYRAKCSEDESEAHQQLACDRTEQRNARLSERTARQVEQAQAKRERDQCQELLGILHGKRQRLAQMSAGEMADFERSNANYHARCSAR